MLTDKEIMEPIREWLLTYPYSAPFGSLEIDHGQIDHSDRHGEGNALRLVSRLKINERKNTWGTVTETWRINFVLTMWRDSNDNDLRREISEFILQFIQWVNDENRKRGKPDANLLLPRFSDTEQEVISADGGGQTATLTTGRDEFAIALHLDFQTRN